MSKLTSAGDTFAPADRSYRPDIDGLRALAVALVLLFHFEVPGFSGGFIGVDVFFVISGLLISRMILSDVERGKFRFRTFYMRRIRRLLPACLVTIAITLIVGSLLFHPLHLEQLGRQAVFSALSVSNILFWHDVGYFDTAGHLKPLLHTWSLAVEEQYYLIWPAFLVVFLRQPRLRAALAFIITAIFLLSLLGSEFMLRREASAAFYLVPFRMFEFLVGFWLAAKPLPRKPREGTSDLLLVLGLALIVGCAMLYDSQTPFPGVRALLPCLGAWLVMLAAPHARLSVLLTNAYSVRVGVLSYSLYLVHWPILVFYKYSVQRALYPLETAGLIALSLLSAYALWRFVENPIHKPSISAGWQLSNPMVLFGNGLLIGVIMLVGASFWNSGGWPNRLSGAQQIFASAGLDMAGKECQILDDAPDWPSCLSGAAYDGNIDVLLIGDSHADHMRAALEPVFETAGLTAGHQPIGGCAPLAGVFTMAQTANHIAACRSATDAAFSFADTPNIQVVILAARWSFYTESTPAGLEGVQPFDLRYELDDDSHATREVFEKGMEAAVTHLVEEGKKVILMGQVPEIGLDPVICLGRPFPGIAGTENPCRYLTRQEALDRLQFSNDTMKAISARFPNKVLFIDNSAYFCENNAQYCRMFVADRLAYRDDDHLSLSGAMAMGKWLLPSVSEFLKTDYRNSADDNSISIN